MNVARLQLTEITGSLCSHKHVISSQKSLTTVQPEK